MTRKDEPVEAAPGFRPTVVWNGAGLAATMTGIERLAAAYTFALHRAAPDVHQIFIGERAYLWLEALAPHVDVRIVPHLPATIAMPRWSGRLGRAAWHTWANPAVPRVGIRAHLSTTIHDWTPFEPGGMLVRHRVLWQAALLANIASSGALHFTTQDGFDRTPPRLFNIVRRRVVLVGGDIPTLRPLPHGGRSGNYVLAVGTNIPRKRFAETAKIWRRSEFDELPPLRFVGKGTELLGSGSRFAGLGYLPDAELGQLVAGASAMVSLSDREGLNLPAREALRYGVPVVGTHDSLGTLASNTGVHAIDLGRWADYAHTASVVAGALRDALRERAAGAPIGADLGDGDALTPWLVGRARTLAAGGR